MASIRVSELTPTATAAADSFLYLADTTNGGVDFDSKKITVANFLNAYATETFVNTAIENLINGAPEALDTLKEISDAIGDSGDIVGNLIGMINANEVHMDNMASLSGVAKDETELGSFSGSTIGDGSDIKSALQALETSLETKASSAAVNSNVSNTNDLVSLSGMASGSVHMGLFDGDTLSDNATLKVVLQSAETAIEANASAISQEVSDRAAAVAALTNGAVASNTSAISQEVTDRAAAITALTNGAVATNANGVSTNAAAITALTNGAVASNTAAIAQEVTDRQAAVSVEATARADADALLMPKAGGTFTGPISGPVPTADAHLATKKFAEDLVAGIDLSQIETNRLDIISETTARTSADSALSGRLDVLEADPTTQTLLTAETTARTSADSALSGRLDVLEADPTTATALSSEATTRAAADTALSGRLDTLEADPTTATALSSEASTRAAADTALSGRLDVLEADPTTATALSSEASTRASADTALSNRLDTLEADPTTQTLLDAETAARIAGDALLLPLAGGTMTGAINLGSSGSAYTSNVSVTAATTTPSYPISYVFDGNNSEVIGENFRFTDSNAPHYVSFEPLTVTSSLRIWVDTNRSGIDLNVDQGGANVVSFTENNGGSNNDPIAWVTLPVTTPFTLTSIGRNFGYGSWMYLGAIEVDGVIIAEGATIGGSGGASVIDVDGTASFGGNVTAAAVPSDDAHLVNKLYVDNQVAGVDLSGIATNAAAIEALTSGAPELLNTLSELADAINDDENFATTITNQISSESTTRAAADTALSGRLDVLEADPTTATALSSEASTRAAADTALSGRLDTLEADPTTQTLLTAETTARTSADTALSGRLDTLEADPTTATALSSEASTRAAADTALSGRLDVLEADPTTQTLLDAETTSRVSGDNALSGRLDVLEADPTTATALSAEATTRAAADSALSGRLDVLEVDPTTQSAVTAEANTRATADTALSGRLDVLEADPTTQTALDTVSTTLSNSITAEETARIAADALLMPKSGGTFTGAISGPVPTADSHLATKKFAEDLVAGIDLSQIETNRLDIIQEISDRAAAITALTNGAVATNASNIAANSTAIAQEVTDRAAAITALTNGQVATNTSGIATNATAITNLTNGAVADNAAAITALANGAVATNTAAIAQEVTDRQAAIAALTNGAVADNAAAVTALANGAVATNAAAIAQETTDRIAADALKVDKQSTVNEHMLGQTSAQSEPVDAEGNSNYLFLVVDKATGALKSIDKTFLEAE